MFLLLNAFLFIEFCSIVLSATITEPRDVTALVDSTAVFGCSAKEYDLLQWTYEGLKVTERIKQQYQIYIVNHNISDDMLSSSLYITATLDNDRRAIGCRLISYFPFKIISIGAHLHVRRIGPVRNLLSPIDIDDVPYNVTWTIPSVIATDTPVSNIRYTVTIEGGNITSTVSDIDDTYYQFTDITVLNCTVYTAIVTAYDVTHQSHTSDIATVENNLSKS